MNVRLLFLTVVAVVGGPWMIWSGFQDYRNNNRLAADGVNTPAQVLDKSVMRRTRGADRYFISAAYRTEAGQDVRRNVQVVEREYDLANPGGNVTLRYLPSNSNVSTIGEAVPTWRRTWLSGSLILLCGFILAGFSARRFTIKTAAGKIAE